MPDDTMIGDHSGVTYTPFVANDRVGYRAEGPEGVAFIYLRPSVNEDGSDDHNVFLYHGADGDPVWDQPVIHVRTYDCPGPLHS